MSYKFDAVRFKVKTQHKLYDNGITCYLPARICERLFIGEVPYTMHTRYENNKIYISKAPFNATQMQFISHVCLIKDSQSARSLQITKLIRHYNIDLRYDVVYRAHFEADMLVIDLDEPVIQEKKKYKDKTVVVPSYDKVYSGLCRCSAATCECSACPYDGPNCARKLAEDAKIYILYLKTQLQNSRRVNK